MGEIADWITSGPTPDDMDMYEEQTGGLVYEGKNSKPQCTNCDSYNIKTSSKGNLYCADLCWVEEKEV